MPVDNTTGGNHVTGLVVEVDAIVISSWLGMVVVAAVTFSGRVSPPWLSNHESSHDPRKAHNLGGSALGGEGGI